MEGFVIGKTAFIFPGQGAQFVGMGRDLHEHHEEAKSVYDTAQEILGFDLARICFEGPEDELKRTRITQPAIFVHSCTITQLLRKKGVVPAMTAGHSLGEYSALWAAGSLKFEDALRLVKLRGEMMQKAGEINAGTMAAIIGLDASEVIDICETASATGIVQVANYNSPGQLVVSGSVNGVEKAMFLAKENGAKMVIPLVVSGAFHSPLMEYAKEGLAVALHDSKLADTNVPVYTNVTAQPVTKSQEIKKLLVAQLTAPVRWTEIIENMIQDGASKFYEVGPGSVLKGLLKRIDRSVEGISVGDLRTLEAIED